MPSAILRNLSCALVVMGLMLGVAPSGALAQDAAVSAQRDAVFQQMFGAPDDRGLMLDYARLSVRMRDYEAAVSTLERLLQLDPTDGTARYELAIAYQALGAQELAQYHFGLVTPADPDTAEELAAYQQQNRSEQAPSRLRGHISAGVMHRDGSTGAIGRVQLTWRADFGGSNRDYWQTDLQLVALGAVGNGLNDRQALSLRTGPWLTLGDTAYGARLRPYLEARLDRDTDGLRRRTAYLGMQYSNTHTRQLSSFADIKIGHASRSGSSRRIGQMSAGVTWRPDRDTRLRFSGRIGQENGDGRRIHLRGLRADFSHEFSVAEALPRKWVANAHVQNDWIRETGTSPRNEQLASAGVGMRAFVTRDVYVDASARALRRSSNIPERARRQSVFTLQIGREF